jgi:hypothetical protein
MADSSPTSASAVNSADVSPGRSRPVRVTKTLGAITRLAPKGQVKSGSFGPCRFPVPLSVSLT